VIAVLAVTPQQAEVIRFAQLDGNVSLALRSPADFGAGQVSTSGITLQELRRDVRRAAARPSHALNGSADWC